MEHYKFEVADAVEDRIVEVVDGMTGGSTFDLDSCVPPYLDKMVFDNLPP